MDGNKNNKVKSKVNPETGLTLKEELFCMYYVKFINNGRAAYQAVFPKCKDSSAMTKAWQLLRKVEIKAYIEKLREDLKKETIISLEQSVAAAQDIYADSVKQIKITDIKGNDTGQTKMADAKAANEALKTIGKWLGFENQTIKVEADDAMKQYYEDLSKRLKGRTVEGVDDDE